MWGVGLERGCNGAWAGLGRGLGGGALCQQPSLQHSSFDVMKSVRAHHRCELSNKCSCSCVSLQAKAEGTVTRHAHVRHTHTHININIYTHTHTSHVQTKHFSPLDQSQLLMIKNQLRLELVFSVNQWNQWDQCQIWSKHRFH